MSDTLNVTPSASPNAPRIMIVEDEALVALMVEDLLTDFGCQISGSFGAVDEALAYLRSATVPPPALDGAVLDVNIGGTMVFPVAERLRAAGIPFVFATGYAALPRVGFEEITVLNKPIDPQLLENAVRSFRRAA